MQIYVIRHGETSSNISGIVSGRSDEGLTSNGITQAQLLNLKLANTKFAAVYVSPMRRAIETAEIIVPEYNYIIDERISERDLGDLRGYTIDELWQHPLWNSVNVLRTSEGAETFGSGLERVREFLAAVKAQHGGDAASAHSATIEPASAATLDSVPIQPKDSKVLLITHSFISRCIWAITNKISDEKSFSTFSHKNDEIKIYHI